MVHEHKYKSNMELLRTSFCLYISLFFETPLHLSLLSKSTRIWNSSQTLAFSWSHAYSSQQIIPSSAECLIPWAILVKLIVSFDSNKIMFMKVFLWTVQYNYNWDSISVEHLLWASQILWRPALCSITHALCSSPRLELPRAILLRFNIPSSWHGACHKAAL